jgi:hypothetical protein
MYNLLTEYKKYFSEKDFLISLFQGSLLLVASIVANFYAAHYATISASSSVTDIILSNTRVYDVDGFFVFGAIALVFIIVLVCLLQPRRIIFVLKSVALFILIRSLFITLTHIGPFPNEVAIDGSTAHYAKELIGGDLFRAFFSGNDLFFSGHTGLPFLLALICWDNLGLRCLFIASSIAFGTAVLLGHLHYSIDVLAAFFITASIFNISKYIFRKDYLRMSA